MTTMPDSPNETTQGSGYILLRHRAIPHLDQLEVYRQNGGFVHHVFDVCADKARRRFRQRPEVDAFPQRLAAHMHFENFFAALDIRPIECYAPIEPAPVATAL